MKTKVNPNIIYNAIINSKLHHTTKLKFISWLFVKSPCTHLGTTDCIFFTMYTGRNLDNNGDVRKKENGDVLALVTEELKANFIYTAFTKGNIGRFMNGQYNKCSSDNMKKNRHQIALNMNHLLSLVGDEYIVDIPEPKEFQDISKHAKLKTHKPSESINQIPDNLKGCKNDTELLTKLKLTLSFLGINLSAELESNYELSVYATVNDTKLKLSA